MKKLFYMHIWLVESSMVTVLRKANFSLLQRNIFYLNTKFVENIENGKSPSQSQLKVIINPTKLILSDEIKSIIQVPDTQNVHNRGHG